MVKGLIKLFPHTRFNSSVHVACSGGADSVALACFLGQVFLPKPPGARRKVTLVYYNHATPHAQDAEIFVRNLALKYGWALVVGKYSGKPTETAWRTARYEYFRTLEKDIYTAHHLDDCVETWIMTACHGQPYLIPRHNQDLVRPHSIFRPFLLNTKETLIKYLKSNNQDWINDPTNLETGGSRNLTRNAILPLLSKINPNMQSSIRRLILAQNQD